jgi:hypothetical protein
LWSMADIDAAIARAAQPDAAKVMVTMG